MTDEPRPGLSPESQGTAPARGRLIGRRVLVVGAGQNDYGVADPPIGNGRAMAILFAREGARVAVADRDRASAETTAARITGEGGQAFTVVADMAKPDNRSTIAALRFVHASDSGVTP
jgi:NAD(P)-dependent dehydrogenase (short-subunit alcohol dehydrogenase family)